MVIRQSPKGDTKGLSPWRCDLSPDLIGVDSPDVSGRIGGGLEPALSDILTMNVSDSDRSESSSKEVSHRGASKGGKVGH